MIVKIPESRKDKKTSFNDLAKYITQELHESNNIEASSFNNLTRYITRESVPDDLTGIAIEKTIGVAIGNLHSLASAAKEMQAVSEQNKRVTDPVFHFILSWQEQERPTVEEMIEAARDAIKALGMEEHQYIIAAHANTDNLHVHVEINRVNPNTLKSKHIAWSYKTLHKAIREIEIKNNWEHDNGIFQVIEENGKKIIVEREADENEIQLEDVETWSGETSFKGYVSNYPAKAIKKMLGNMTSWQDLHNALHRFSLTLENTGGGMLITGVSDIGDEISIKCSSAMRFLKKKELEQKWGTFVYPDGSENDAEVEIPDNLDKEYKRDKTNREKRKKERVQARIELKKNYTALKEKNQKKRNTLRSNLKKDKDAATKKIKGELSKKLKKLKAIKDRQQRELVKTALLLKYKEDLKAITDKYKAETAAINHEQKTDWKEFLEDQAKENNSAAISALRGIDYRERSKIKKFEEQEKAEQFWDEEDRVRFKAFKSKLEDKKIPIVIPNYEWKLIGKRIEFRNNHGELAFADEGFNVRLDRKIVTDEDLKAAMLHAAMKFGKDLTFSGGDSVFQQRVIRMAIELNLTLNGKDKEALQKLIPSETKENELVYQAREAVKSFKDFGMGYDLSKLARISEKITDHAKAKRVYFKVPYKLKEKVKELGCKWDKRLKAWFITADKSTAVLEIKGIKAIAEKELPEKNRKAKKDTVVEK